MRITKLDKRHSGRIWFAYYVVVTTPDPWATLSSSTNASNLRLSRRTFQMWRVWCNETFGPGCERDWVVDVANDFDPPRWGWCTDERIVGTLARLYLKSEEELTLFKLKWS